MQDLILEIFLKQDVEIFFIRGNFTNVFSAFYIGQSDKQFFVVISGRFDTDTVGAALYTKATNISALRTIQPADAKHSEHCLECERPDVGNSRITTQTRAFAYA